MRVAIDFFKQIKGKGKSIGIYNETYNIIKSLSDIKNNDRNYSDLRIFVICNEFNKCDLLEFNNIELIEIKTLNSDNKLQCIYWETLYVNKVLKDNNIDVVLFPRGFTSINCPVKDIVIVNDMIPFYYHNKYPGYLNRFENFYIMNRLKYSIRHSKKIITISEFSKKEILKYCDIDSNKVSVIYCGINEIDYKRFGEKSGDYIIAMTTSMPHKNAIGIIRSYEKYLDLVDKPLDLVVVGVEKEPFIGLVNDEVLSKIRFIKYISSNDDLYKMIYDAKLFMFLSHIEGFGMPPLEAFSLRVPVICSNTSSLPEVTCGSAIMVDPKDYESVAKNMVEVLSNDLKAINMVEKGYSTYEMFRKREKGYAYLNELLNT